MNKIHKSVLAIIRFIANLENEQTSNELANVVHGVVAGTESADILMLILMIFLIRYDDKRIDQMADMADNAEAFFVRKPDVPRADDDNTDGCEHENTVNQLVDVMCSRMRTFTGQNTIMSCLRILRFCGVSQVELYRVLMTAAEEITVRLSVISLSRKASRTTPLRITVRIHWRTLII